MFDRIMTRNRLYFYLKCCFKHKASILIGNLYIAGLVDVLVGVHNWVF